MEKFLGGPFIRLKVRQKDSPARKENKNSIEENTKPAEGEMGKIANNFRSARQSVKENEGFFINGQPEKRSAGSQNNVRFDVPKIDESPLTDEEDLDEPLKNPQINHRMAAREINVDPEVRTDKREMENGAANTEPREIRTEVGNAGLNEEPLEDNKADLPPSDNVEQEIEEELKGVCEASVNRNRSSNKLLERGYNAKIRYRSYEKVFKGGNEELNFNNECIIRNGKLRPKTPNTEFASNSFYIMQEEDKSSQEKGGKKTPKTITLYLIGADKKPKASIKGIPAAPTNRRDQLPEGALCYTEKDGRFVLLYKANGVEKVLEKLSIEEFDNIHGKIYGKINDGLQETLFAKVIKDLSTDIRKNPDCVTLVKWLKNKVKEIFKDETELKKIYADIYKSFDIEISDLIDEWLKGDKNRLQADLLNNTVSQIFGDDKIFKLEGAAASQMQAIKKFIKEEIKVSETIDEFIDLASNGSNDLSSIYTSLTNNRNYYNGLLSQLVKAYAKTEPNAEQSVYGLRRFVAGLDFESQKASFLKNLYDVFKGMFNDGIEKSDSSLIDLKMLFKNDKSLGDVNKPANDKLEENNALDPSKDPAKIANEADEALKTPGGDDEDIGADVPLPQNKVFKILRELRNEISESPWDTHRPLLEAFVKGEIKANEAATVFENYKGLKQEAMLAKYKDEAGSDYNKVSDIAKQESIIRNNYYSFSKDRLNQVLQFVSDTVNNYKVNNPSKHEDLHFNMLIQFIDVLKTSLSEFTNDEYVNGMINKSVYRLSFKSTEHFLGLVDSNTSLIQNGKSPIILDRTLNCDPSTGKITFYVEENVYELYKNTPGEDLRLSKDEVLAIVKTLQVNSEGGKGNEDGEGKLINIANNDVMVQILNYFKNESDQITAEEKFQSIEGTLGRMREIGEKAENKSYEQKLFLIGYLKAHLPEFFDAIFDPKEDDLKLKNVLECLFTLFIEYSVKVRVNPESVVVPDGKDDKWFGGIKANDFLVANDKDGATLIYMQKLFLTMNAAMYLETMTTGQSLDFTRLMKEQIRNLIQVIWKNPEVTMNTDELFEKLNQIRSDINTNNINARYA